MQHDSRLAFELDAADPDQDPVRTIILKGPEHGLVYGSARNFSYVPKPLFSGTDRFTYKLWDGQKFGKPGLVTITVSGPEPEPALRFQSLRHREDLVELVVQPGAASFSIHASTNLVSWFYLAGPFATNGQTRSIFDTNNLSRWRFYRAVAE